MKASEYRRVSPEIFINVNTVSENILTEALAISKVYSEFVKDVNENVNKFEIQYSEIKAKLRDSEIPHEVETSLVRIPGILSVGYQHKRFNISYRGSSKHEILHQLRCSIGNFTEINESSVTLCPSHGGFTFDVRSGDLVEGERIGTLTILARHGRSSDPRMYGITCAHVLPDDPDAPAYLYASDCRCPNPTNNCICCYRSKILVGNCLYKMGPYEKNPVNSDLIDIASFMIPFEREQQCDLRIFGPENGMRIVDQGLQLEGSRVFMRGPNNDISYGQHIGFADLFPAEGLTCPLDSDPQYMYQIPFGSRPRRVELVQSENGQRLGHPGYSGALISVLKIDEDVTYMKPALMYLGAWPGESDSISMCSRLQESLDRLTEKHGGQAEFVLCYNNSGHGRESMRTNMGKRKANDS